MTEKTRKTCLLSRNFRGFHLRKFSVVLKISRLSKKDFQVDFQKFSDFQWSSSIFKVFQRFRNYQWHRKLDCVCHQGVLQIFRDLWKFSMTLKKYWDFLKRILKDFQNLVTIYSNNFKDSQKFWQTFKVFQKFQRSQCGGKSVCHHVILEAFKDLQENFRLPQKFGNFPRKNFLKIFQVKDIFNDFQRLSKILTKL